MNRRQRRKQRKKDWDSIFELVELAEKPKSSTKDEDTCFISYIDSLVKKEKTNVSN